MGNEKILMLTEDARKRKDSMLAARPNPQIFVAATFVTHDSTFWNKSGGGQPPVTVLQEAGGDGIVGYVQ